MDVLRNSWAIYLLVALLVGCASKNVQVGIGIAGPAVSEPRETSIRSRGQCYTTADCPAGYVCHPSQVCAAWGVISR